jgi:hypothetical protein
VSILIRKKTALRAILIILLITIFLFSPFCAFIRSCAVMLPYSCYHKRNSVLYKNQIKFSISGGLHTKKRDWYPFTVYFNDDEGLSAYLGEPVEFTVLYNFGHFQHLKGASSYYNPNSPYYSSIYGGYILKPYDKNRKFGFQEDGTLNLEELAKIPEFDQKYLLLTSIGCPPEDKVFHVEIISTEYDLEYAGYKGWARVDLEIRTNSPVHEYRGFNQGYLQFGKPMGLFHYKESFPVIDLKGRAYARYFDEFQSTIVLYVMAPSREVVNEADQEILSDTEINKIIN